ncbi:MAG: octaprenyl diphosphate synthase [Gammaproteobacteria bacterium]|nr:octaprenyl diphosphate synthase [Gammaproteobacteria bacterium]
MNTLAPVKELVRQDLVAVDAVIRASMKSSVPLVDQVAEHIITGGGKRLRPLIVLLAARACGYHGSSHIDAAAFIEFIHTATLLHDDVVDGSSRRRGRATANSVYGNQASVLVGDFVYSRAFQMMAAIGSQRVMEVMSEATNVIAEGEVLQLMNSGDPDTTQQRYLEVIYRKTAKLFESGAEVAGVIAGASPSQQRALADYGKHLGTAYQLIDDVLDYRSNPAERGKNLGDDLAEGKPTLPLIQALRKAADADTRALIRDAIENGGLDHLERIVTTIESTGALEYTRALAQDEADQALTALHALPESPHKQGLAALARFAVERSS